MNYDLYLFVTLVVLIASVVLFFKGLIKSAKTSKLFSVLIYLAWAPLVWMLMIGIFGATSEQMCSANVTCHAGEIASQASRKATEQAEALKPKKEHLLRIHHITDRLNEDVYVDYKQQATMAYDHGDYMTACVNMGVAKAGALSAHNTEMYETALTDEKMMCHTAGLTR
jgi:hypothetical protein